MNYRCLLFDLDGTLVDSRADIINSVNFALLELGHARLPDAQVLTFVGEGARLLVERALRAARGVMPTQGELDAAYEVFKRQYRAHLFDHTRTYPGVEATLDHFADLPKAIVTNKPHDLTVALLDGIGLTHHFCAILGGDSLPERKPDPSMLLEAARLCGVAPSDCLMIGDSWVDVRAGQAAGMKTCGFVMGFRGRAELVEAGADYLLEGFDELGGIVRGAQTVT